MSMDNTLKNELDLENRIENHYVIFSGVFSYRRDTFRDSANRDYLSHYNPWFRAKSGTSYNYYTKVLQKQYYPTFLDFSVPEYRLFEKNPDKSINMNSSDFYSAIAGKNKEPAPVRLRSVNCDNLQNCSIIIKDGQIIFNIEYADIILYPEGTGIFLFKAVIESMENTKGVTTLNNLSDFINAIRKLESQFTLPNGETINTSEFVNSYILHQTDYSSLINDFTTATLLDKLKSYTVFEMYLEDHSDDKENEILYELGSVAPVGTIKNNGFFSPSNDYFNKIIEEHKVSVFKWWSVLNLNDTVTVLITRPESKKNQFSTFSSFEDIYLHFYIQTLFLKFSMFQSNYELSRLSIRNRLNPHIRDRIIEIRNKYNFSHISYNFLPNLLYMGFKHGMDIENEVERMEEKLERINSYIMEKQERKTNILLVFISFLAVGSAFLDTTDWLDNIFSLSSRGYNYVSGILVSITLLGGLSIVLYQSHINQNSMSRKSRKKSKKGILKKIK